MEDTIRSEILVRFAGLAQQVGLDPITALLLLIGVAPGWNVAKAGWRSACLAYRGAKAVWGWTRSPALLSDVGSAVLALLTNNSGRYIIEPDPSIPTWKIHRLYVAGGLAVKFDSDRFDHLVEVVLYDRNILLLLSKNDLKAVTAAAHNKVMFLQAKEHDYQRMEALAALSRAAEANDGNARQSCS